MQAKKKTGAPATVKSDGAKSQNEVIRDREKNFKVLRIIAIVQAILLAVVVSFGIFVMLRFVGAIWSFNDQGGSHQESIWMGISFVQCLNVMAILLYWFGLYFTKVELVYGYLIVNIVWAMVSIIVLIIGNTLKDSNTSGFLYLTIVGIFYCAINLAVIATVIITVTNLRATGKVLTQTTGRSVLVLSRTETITEVPVVFGQKQGAKVDASVTEATLRFQESVHR